MDYSFSKGSWEEAGLWAKLDALCYIVESHSDLFLKILRCFSSKEVELVMATVWGIWRHRNTTVDDLPDIYLFVNSPVLFFIKSHKFLESLYMHISFY